jgi:hypothetical protein
MKKIAVIGFGAASIGFLETLANNNEYQIDVFEKSKDSVSSSLSGIRSDGKLFVTDDTGLDIDIPMDLQLKARRIYFDNLPKYMNMQCEPTIAPETKEYHSFSDQSEFMKFYNQGFKPIKAIYSHIGTDTLKTVVPSIFKKLEMTSNIRFTFDIEVTEISKKESGKYKIYSRQHDTITEYDSVIVSVGRSGYKLIKGMDSFVKRNGHTNVDIGVRFELPNILVDKLNKDNYEWKVRYKTKTGYVGRTFCNNPSGLVTVENYKDIKTVNGHSNSNGGIKTDNTNFAILISTSLTEPFSDPNEYGEYIARLGNKLAGENKVMLQTVGDFLNFKRTKKLGRVKPSLDMKEVELCDINLALPAKIRESLADFIQALARVEPNIAQHDNLMYGIEVKFYSNKMENKDGVYFIGDCSGHTRSICHATAHGIMTAEEILR